MSEAIFANVRLNQKIADHCKINELFIILNMGDAGLSLGATMSEGHSTHRRSPIALDNAFVGPNINEDNALHVLNEKGWRIESDASPMNIAELLSKGAIIAQCQGRREVGSRVLVNRSILANPAIPQIVQRLNHSLNRSDFMTFAQIIAEESIEGVLQWKPIYQHGCKYMTTTVQAASELKALLPSIVHVDGRLRPQIITQSEQPNRHAILRCFEEISGLPILINTSFNIHEEPIVATAQDAIRACEDA